MKTIYIESHTRGHNDRGRAYPLTVSDLKELEKEEKPTLTPTVHPSAPRPGGKEKQESVT